MTVKEFSERTGVPPSKIRFYDRENIIQSGRKETNNYRSFSDSDALNIYNAQMLRSFDFGLQDVLAAQNEDLNQIGARVESRIATLEASIREQEIRLVRLREMEAYFHTIRSNAGKVSVSELEESYNIWTINAESSEAEREAVKSLAEVMPFSYICIKISRQSVLQSVREETDRLDVSLGLGILESNRKKIGLRFPAGIKKDARVNGVSIMIECEDPFCISTTDIAPLLAYQTQNGHTLETDIVGRIFISYKRDNRLVHGLCLGYSIDTGC